MNMPFEGAVVKSVSIENMLNQRHAVLSKVRQALDILAEARELAIAAHVGFPRLKFEQLRYGDSILDPTRMEQTVESFRKQIDRDAWQYLMGESGLRTFMDAEARRKWDEAIMQGEFPELTAENVAATFRTMHDARGDMFERGVISVFKKLGRWDYKTNRPTCFGPKIILRGLRSQVMKGERFGYVNHRSCDELDDLTRVMHVMDGKPEPDHRQGWWHIINLADNERRDEAETEYARVRWFKNGNGHLWFKRMELVDRMNLILRKHYPGALAFDKYAEATP